ncbi:F-box/LRR-repeat protein 14-like [Silene latifolia]|uniref:F-box/LRR-repeat protein 14-like n=1 Tax=Silene latifolia TaxID=37657 RepID=UPI003D779CCF
MEAETHKNLPICWDIIFDKLNNPSDRDSISLVCKEFLSITNLIQESLTVISPSINVLVNLLHRFPNSKKIQLMNFQGDLNRAIQVISQSGLNLEELDLSHNENLPDVCLQNLSSAMKNLKILDCSHSSMKDPDLLKIANYFPQLEDINISYSCVDLTDQGIEFLASNLKRLRKVDVTGNTCITDKSVISLSLNCHFLEQFIADSPVAKFEIGSFGVENSIDLPKNLVSLKFTNLKISDQFLQSVAKAEIPLTELSLLFCKSYTFSGISSLLRSHPCLKSLALFGADFLTNEHIDYLCQFLANLKTIKLNCCPLLSDSAFVTLSERCNLLSRLEIGNTCLGKEELINDDHPVKNYAVRFLRLWSIQFLCSAYLRKVLLICPNLEKLDLSNCFRGTELLDVADILDYSPRINSLVLNQCRHLRFCREQAKASKLEKLVAMYSGINDEILAMIGRNSPGLLYLDLEECKNVTEKGVKAVIESCKRLRYLNLSGCLNVNVDVLEYIVQNEPSLRRLVSPSCKYPKEDDQKYFLQRNCLVTRAVDIMESLPKCLFVYR